MYKFLAAFLFLVLPLSYSTAEHFLPIQGALIVVYSYFAGRGLCNSHDDVLTGAEGDEFIAGIGVLVAEEERGGAGFDEVAGLLGVETLESAEDEIVGFDYFGLFGVVCVAGHRGVELVEVLGSSDAVCGFFVHLKY